MNGRTYGHTKNGKPITDEMIQELTDEAERRYEPGQLDGRRRGQGRPLLGEAATSEESFRLEPAPQVETARRQRLKASPSRRSSVGRCVSISGTTKPGQRLA